MPFTIHADPHTQSRQTLRVWGFFELFPFWKQLAARQIIK